jgi:hypothetical protein
MASPDRIERVPPVSPLDGEPCQPPSSAPYADALQGYTASFDARDFDSALALAEELVALEPGIVEPYHCRAAARQTVGDDVQAAADRARCAAIDPHYREAAAIREATARLRAAYENDPVLGDGMAAHEFRHEGLRDVLERRARETARRRALLARPSCDLPCPSACCYFEDETLRYGVAFKPKEANVVVSHLVALGLDPDEYVAKTSPDSDRPEQQRPPTDADDSDESVLHYPRLDSRPFPLADTVWRPRSRGYRDLSWLTRRSRACVFIGPRGCAIHDVGSPPGVTACRAFLCLAAFVFVVLKDLGVVRAGDVARRSMSELQEAALAALPLLVSRAQSADDGSEQEQMRQALSAAANQDRAGDRAAADVEIERYHAAQRRRADAEQLIDRRLKDVVGSLLASRTP